MNDQRGKEKEEPWGEKKEKLAIQHFVMELNITVTDNQLESGKLVSRSVSTHALGVATLPGSSMRATNGVVRAMTLDSQSTVLLARGGQAAALAVLVNGIANPVDAGIVTDGHVVRVDEDDLEVLVGSVLVDPVRVEDAQVGADTAGALLGNAAQVADELELVDTLVLGLSVDNALVVRSLATATANSHAVDNVSLLGLVSKLVGLLSASRSVDLLDLLGLAVLPSSAKNIHGQTREDTHCQHGGSRFSNAPRSIPFLESH